MVIYNTATANDVVPGLYYNDEAKWPSVKPAPDETSGAVLTKVKYRGRNLESNGFDKPTLKVPSMNMKFRFATYDVTNNPYTYIETRLLTQPVSDVTYYATILWFGSGNNGAAVFETFTPANWNQRSQKLSYNDNWYYPYGFQIQISTKDGVTPGTNDLKTGNFYGFDGFGNGARPENETYIIAFNQY